MLVRARALWLAPGFILVAIVAHILAQPELEEGVSASPEARARFAAIVRSAEPRMRREALRAFPGSPWSQGDDFGSRERALIRGLVGQEGTRPGAVLDAIDRDVKAHPGKGERGAVAACMPRPFYD